MKLSISVLAILALVLAIPARPQDGSTSITIVNHLVPPGKQNAVPLTLYVNGNYGCGPVTDDGGSCEAFVNPGQYTFEVKAPGYPTRTKEKYMPHGERFTWTISAKAAH
jgi:hypothetical protein